jgi:hypothetical protein
MKFIGFVLVLVALAVVVASASGGEEPDVILEIWRAPKDSKPIETKPPGSYKGFEKRVRDLEGKTVLDLLGKKISIRLQNQRLLGKKHKLCTGADFAHAILAGRIISQAKMRYHLQPNEQESIVKTTAGEGRVGIYYPPVGYVVMPNGESYWFLFGEKDVREGAR